MLLLDNVKYVKKNVIKCPLSVISAGISPVHDLRKNINSKITGDAFLFSSPYKVLKHLDNSVLKATKNVTQNPEMDVTLHQLSKDLVTAILSKLEIQDKITRITREALEASGQNKGITAIETRRILDYISRSLSGHILSITRTSTELELHRLVYGLAQISAEVSIVSALKDITYATSLSKRQSIDLSLRKKRSAAEKIEESSTMTPSAILAPSIYSVILNKTISSSDRPNTTLIDQDVSKKSPFSLFSRNEKKPVRLIMTKSTNPLRRKGFLNQTALDIENSQRIGNATGLIVLDNTINGTHNKVRTDVQNLDEGLKTTELLDYWIDSNDSVRSALNTDIIAEMEIEQTEVEDEAANEKKSKQKIERLESKAKKAILYAGDVAYLTAASVVAMRRALTAAIEVHMSIKYAKNGMANHQDLMMNLAKTAAQQAGKEAKSATSKSLACERVVKLALKYVAQSNGAKLNHVANRIVIDTIPLATLAKSMAFVSSDIAINSLYQATDVKPPS